MTVYCPAVDTSLGLRDWASTGVSDAARHVKVALEESLEHYLETRLGLLLPEIENLPVVCNETSIPVDPDTIRAATQFAYSLPRFVPIPEVSADPDGEISFDWTGPSGEMFSVSVNKRNRLAYAGWFGEKSRVHGIEQLAEGCPQQIVRGIEKAIR
ncbi:MAG: hypothetical protein AUH11_11660 [Acidobacteria bacterium 13_2_20CM_57_17]|nr:MAG: hypothetical protein AUH11_11660 [Acidobacteria bacterium 13_2_20CM_57_17]OLB93962.1 MAG: hypothetical protein AUI02_05930 [Acidobacteria bacterium 13_2_20CM_2_57_12]